MWRTIHVFYYASDKDQLLLTIECIMGSLRERVPSLEYYVRRHWKRGPHIRLNYRVSDSDYQRVTSRLFDTLKAFVEEHPSVEQLDEKQLEPLHRHLARLERETGPLFPLMKDNSVVVAEYDDRRKHLQGADATEVMARAWISMTPYVVNVIKVSKADYDLRIRIALQMMLVLAQPEKASGYRNTLTFRSHLEGFLRTVNDPDGLIDAFNKRAERLELLKEPFCGYTPDITSVADDWGVVLHGWFDLFKKYVAERGLQPNAAPLPVADASAFHRALYSNPKFVEYITSPEFETVRLVVNFMYLTYIQMGLKPIDKYFLCWTICQMLEPAGGWGSVLETWAKDEEMRNETAAQE